MNKEIKFLQHVLNNTKVKFEFNSNNEVRLHVDDQPFIGFNISMVDKEDGRQLEFSSVSCPEINMMSDEWKVFLNGSSHEHSKISNFARIYTSRQQFIDKMNKLNSVRSISTNEEFYNLFSIIKVVTHDDESNLYYESLD